jgi:hypothetical protein
MNSETCTFEEWLNSVNNSFVNRFGLHTSDVQDHNWWDLWEDGLTEDEAIEDFVDCNPEFQL